VGVASSGAPDGAYKLSGIPAGEWQVTVTAAKHQTQTNRIPFSDHQTVNMDFALQPLELQDVSLPAGERL
jgi:hypothetical protein